MNENKLKWSIIRFVVAVAVAVTLVVVIVVREGEVAHEVRAGLIANCEKNGNPLRNAVIAVLEEEIKQSRNKTLIRELFPQIPGNQIDKLIAESVERKRKTIRRIAPIDCQKAYK